MSNLGELTRWRAWPKTTSSAWERPGSGEVDEGAWGDFEAFSKQGGLTIADFPFAARVSPRCGFFRRASPISLSALSRFVPSGSGLFPPVWDCGQGPDGCGSQISRSDRREHRAARLPGGSPATHQLLYRSQGTLVVGFRFYHQVGHRYPALGNSNGLNLSCHLVLPPSLVVLGVCRHAGSLSEFFLEIDQSNPQSTLYSNHVS